MREQEIPDVPAMAAMSQGRVPAVTPERTAPVAEENWVRWGWLRHWEFWVALGVGAFLRLWQLGTTSFLDDQTGLYALARSSVLHHAIPLTGIPSSIGTLNPPLSIFLLLPFAAFTANPFAAVVSVALWNIAGVALCYIFGLRYFGRRVAAVGTLLFATGGSALNFSRFLWQQNYLPPLLVLWALTLYMGAVRGERRWLAGNILLLAAAIQLHPTTALLAPITLVGILLAPQVPRLRAYVVGAVGVIVLFIPTAIFELSSHGFDLHKLAHYFIHGGRFTLDVFRILWGALDAPSSGDLGPSSLYASFHRWYFFATWGVVLVVLSGWIVLTGRVFGPALALWRERATEPGTLTGKVRTWGMAVWRGLRADAGWRSRFLLWLWVTFPPLTMLHSNGNLFTHYMLVIFPAIFLAGGFGVDWLLTRFGQVSSPVSTRGAARMRRVRLVQALAVAVVALVAAGSATHYFLYPTALASGNFQAYYSYGYPLDEMTALDEQLSTLQREQGAATTYIVTPMRPRYAMPEQYLLAADRMDRVAFPSSCLVLPAAGDAPALAVSLAPGTPAETLLSALPNAQAVASVPMAGGNPLVVYRIAAATPALTDDMPVQGVSYLNGSGDGLRLDGFSLAAPGMLRLRWTILGAPPAGPGTPFYRVSLPQSASGATPAPEVDCGATQLHAGETIFTWVPLPAQLTLSSAEIAAGSALQVSAGTQAFEEFSVGPVRFITDQGSGAPLKPLAFAGQG